MSIASKKRHPSLFKDSKLVCKDHLVSGEQFKISEDRNGILKTSPVPVDLTKYYESEDYISHSDSKNNLLEKIYQLVKSFMLSKKSKWVRDFFRQGDILDLGAGTGEFLIKMKSFQWNVTGIEPNESARKLALKKGLNLKADLTQLKDQEFDVISLWHVLEHLPDLNNKIVELGNILKDDGVLIIAVPNYESYDAQYYKENWAAWDVPRHLWHFSRRGITEKFAEHNFQLVDEKPLTFDSYYVSLLSEKNKAASNSLNAVFRGFLSNMKARTTGEYSSVTYFFKKSSKT